MLKKIIELKDRIEKLKNDESEFSNKIEKGILCKILVMANIAEMCIYSKTKVPLCDREYFDGRVSIGRYFCDWNLDWVAELYIEITEYIMAKYW